jgi:hypothetical protein
MSSPLSIVSPGIRPSSGGWTGPPADFPQSRCRAEWATRSYLEVWIHRALTINATVQLSGCAATVCWSSSARHGTESIPTKPRHAAISRVLTRSALQTLRAVTPRSTDVARVSVPCRRECHAQGSSALDLTLLTLTVSRPASTEKKVQGHECCDRKRRDDHEHDLHRISSCQVGPPFVARSPLSDEQGHGYWSPINAGFWPCVLQSIT